MIAGIGVDLVEVARMDRVLSGRSAERFMRRVFSPGEISTCRQSAHPAESFAARFAAKEAVAKALGTGFSQGVSPHLIQVMGGDHTRPLISLQGKARELAAAQLITSIHVSLTHTPTTACAFVVAEKGHPLI